MAGLFITFEGGEGGGKSTQAARLARRIAALGREVVRTREPGGTEMAERIRALLVNGAPEALSSTAEALLNHAARDDHLRRVIRPALAAGKVVISDRFMDSTRAYQAYAGDCPLELVAALEREVVGDTVPDCTIIMDIDPAEGLARTRERSAGAGAGTSTGAGAGGAGQGAEDRFERFGLAFHQRLREAFLRIAEENPQRCVVIDAARGEEEVAADVWAAVAPLLERAAGAGDDGGEGGPVA